MKLRQRLILYFIVISVIPVILIGIISYCLSYSNMFENSIEMCDSAVDRVASDIDQFIEESFDLLNFLEDSISNQEAMRARFSTIEEQYESELRISLNMYVESKYHPSIFGLYLLSENGAKYKSSFCTFQNIEFSKTEWYCRAYEASEIEYLGSYGGSSVVSSLKMPMLLFGRAFYDKASGNKVGVMLLEIEQETFNKVLNFNLSGDKLMMLISGECVVSAVGDSSLLNIYYKTVETEEIETRENKPGFFFGQSPIIIKRKIGDTAFSVAYITSEKTLLSDTNSITVAITAMCIVVAILAIIFSLNFSKRISLPIQKLTGLMHKVEEGDLTVSWEPRYNDEISELAHGFTDMVEKINELMVNIQNEHEKLRASETKALLAQITPHFLYNTLGSIACLCKEGKTKEAAEMTDSLATFFRIGLSKGKDIIAIREELLHVENYLKIQGMRGSDWFDYSIEADEELADCITLKFILQPLVENAIYHGIYSLARYKKAHISVEVYAEDENIIMSVRDAGLGINPTRIEALQKALETDVTPEDTEEGYGLVNVNERVKWFFGREYGIRFYSVYGKGATFEIVIPKRTRL